MKMQKYKYLGFTVLAFMAAAVACTKVEHGYLSSAIRYVDNPMQIARGTIQQTAAVSPDGSSAPITYKLLDIRDAATHKHADSLFVNHEHYEWTGNFDPTSDTTVELLNKKRQIVNTPPFEFDTHTGSFTFFGTTAYVPLGTYEFDVQAKNENGVKEYKNIATFTMIDKDPYTIGAGGGAWFQDGTTTSGDIGVPDVTIVKVSNAGTNIVLKITDQNGKPFNPNAGEIIRRGDRADFSSYAQFHPITFTDTTMTCNFETTPFPLRANPSYGYLMYYRIPSGFVKFDPGYTPTTQAIYSANPRFQFQIFQEGTYNVTVKVKHVTHI